MKVAPRHAMAVGAGHQSAPSIAAHDVGEIGFVHDCLRSCDWTPITIVRTGAGFIGLAKLSDHPLVARPQRYAGGTTVSFGTIDSPASPGRDLSVSDVRAFVPSLDFAQSRRFYAALGWTTIWTDDEGMALLELAGQRMMLQNHYVRDWAENFMITVEVTSARDWHDHIVEVLASGEFGHARVATPETEDWGAIVTYVWDPSGVLLHFTQWL